VRRRRGRSGGGRPGRSRARLRRGRPRGGGDAASGGCASPRSTAIRGAAAAIRRQPELRCCFASSRRLPAPRARARWDEQRAWHAARRKPRPHRHQIACSATARTATRLALGATSDNTELLPTLAAPGGLNGAATRARREHAARRRPRRPRMATSPHKLADRSAGAETNRRDEARITSHSDGGFGHAATSAHLPIRGWRAGGRGRAGGRAERPLVRRPICVDVRSCGRAAFGADISASTQFASRPNFGAGVVAP
jgi:hypothetical protein